MTERRSVQASDTHTCTHTQRNKHTEISHAHRRTKTHADINRDHMPRHTDLQSHADTQRSHEDTDIQIADLHTQRSYARRCAHTDLLSHTHGDPTYTLTEGSQHTQMCARTCAHRHTERSCAHNDV